MSKHSGIQLIKIRTETGIIKTASRIGHICRNDFDIALRPVGSLIDDGPRRNARYNAVLVFRDRGDVAHLSTRRIICRNKRDPVQSNGSIRIVHISIAQIIVAYAVDLRRASGRRLLIRRRAGRQCGDGNRRTQHKR